MAFSHDVVLPRNEPPIFPDCCIVCLSESPERKARVFTTVFHLWSLLVHVPHLFSIRVPVCSRCAAGFRIRRLVWVVFDITAILVVAKVSINVIGDARDLGGVWVFGLT